MSETYTVVAPKTEAQLENEVRICTGTKSYKRFVENKYGKKVCPILTPGDLEKEIDCARVYVQKNSEGVPTCYCGPERFLSDSNGQHR